MDRQKLREEIFKFGAEKVSVIVWCNHYLQIERTDTFLVIRQLWIDGWLSQKGRRLDEEKLNKYQAIVTNKKFEVQYEY